MTTIKIDPITPIVINTDNIEAYKLNRGGMGYSVTAYGLSGREYTSRETKNIEEAESLLEQIAKGMDNPKPISVPEVPSWYQHG